ncbi:oligosaccharide flippase family protein [Paenibacillus sp. GCM10027626]|uniref:putative polysaccharide biosynthesis protein n=1 Tax=Paenibacillus sp. GCM10027626 TaxID=3273411 RepID=UPI0036458EBA
MVKKDSLIKGTIILAAAALVARVLGLFQRVPLDYLLDAAGNTYFNAANNVYLLLLVVATGGIPSAISRMVSERYALGRVTEAKQIYRAALWFGAAAGIVIAILLFMLAPVFAQWTGKEDADLAIAAIAPALLVFPVIAMMRGYFQGRQMMMAGGISQIIEQIARVITAIGLVVLILSWGWGQRWLAAGAAFGSVFGSLGAFAVMLYYARKLRKQDALESGKGEQAEKDTSRNLRFRTIYRELFSISVPIVIAAMTVQFIYFFDTNLSSHLFNAFYATEKEAERALFWLGTRAQGVAGIPPILAIALSSSIIPVISSAFSVQNMGEVQRQTSLVMRIVVFTGVPVALALTVGAIPTTGFFFSDADGSGVVAALTAGTIFQITMMTSNSVLFGLGKAKLPMRHTIIGMIVKVAGSLALTPLLGVYGLIIASTLCFLTIASLNFRAIRKEVPFSVLGNRWMGYIATIVLAAGTAWLADWGTRTLLADVPAKIGYFTAAAMTAIVFMAVYLVALVLLKVVTAEDMRQFPGPLRKLLAPVMKLAGRQAQG